MSDNQMSIQSVTQSLQTKVNESASTAIEPQNQVKNNQVTDVEKKNRNTVETDTIKNLDLRLNDLNSVRMEIGIDPDKNQPVITFRSKSTGEAVLQIPAEYSMTIGQTIELMAGQLFDVKT
ncbi:flagellar protein FlaG [Litorivicinus sp.]|nr:flagellar protein FlaG [Litorivicinus sp.]